MIEAVQFSDTPVAPDEDDITFEALHKQRH